MSIVTPVTLKTFFETGDKPSASQFGDFIDTAVRDTMVAMASAAEAGQTGVLDITATADVTLRAVGVVGGQLLGAATTASAQGHIALSAGALGALLLEAGTTASARGNVDALADVVTTQGDVIRGSSTGVAERLARGASGTFVRSDGTDSTYAVIQTGDLPGLPTPDFTSTEQTVAYDTVLDVAHGLGAIPSIVQVVLRNDSDDDGYVADDEIVMYGSLSRTTDAGMQVQLDATNVTIIQGVTLTLLSQATLNAVALDVSKWKWVVRAWI